MPLRPSPRVTLLVAAALLSFIAGAGPVASSVFARSANNPGVQSSATQSPQVTRNAFSHFNPANGAPQSGGTISVGTKFTLDMFVNTGTNQDATASQQYVTFDTGILQVVNPSGTSCTPVQTVAPDTTTFEAALQNQVCNGPNPCTFPPGQQAAGGTISFSSGALSNCPQGCGGDFRVASVTFCAINGGRVTLHWEFSPPGPITRDSEIVDVNSEMIHQPSLYHDYVINVTGPTPTPGPATFTPQPAPTMPPEPGTTPTLPSANCTLSFHDVTASDPFYSYIRNMYCRHVISGYSDGTFRTYDYTMRAQIAKIVVVGFGFSIDTSNGPHFVDVPVNNEFYNYIETAYNRQLISGYDNRLFKPWDNVKRGQIAKIVVSAASQKDPSHWQLANPASPSFLDVPTSNPFYRYVETARAHSLIAGFTDGTFGVESYAKRGQICKIISGAPLP